MDILCIASQKGGVGKTAVALNLGWAFARAGMRALVMDVDPQSGLSRSVAAQLVQRRGFADVLESNARWDEVIIPTRIDGFSLLPLGRVQPWEAAAFEAKLTDGTAFETLREALSDQYDILIVDTPAGLGNATLGALRGSDFVLSPIQAEPGSLRAATTLLEAINHLAATEEYAPLFLGFVLTMVNRADQVSRAVVQEAWSVFPEDLLFETTIARDNLFLESTSKGVPVGALGSKGKRLGLAFEQLVAELQGRMEISS